MDTYGYIYTPGRYTPNFSKLLKESRRERPIDELHRKLSEKEPDVFVSHKGDDRNTALKVAQTIAECGLTAYLDIFDPNVAGDGPELVDYITTIIECCKSLIAVVSYNTVRSWWVPLEIGIAITKDLRLGTFLGLGYNETPRGLPSYLWKWPVLKSMGDLKIWCEERKIKGTTQQFYESLKQKHRNMFEQYPNMFEQ